MAGINKVILIGNLGRDPEMRYTQGGTAVCTLNLATTRSFTKGGQGGERVEETEWHRVTVWGKQAEFCNQYLAKGRQVYVEGRLKTDSYEDKDGVKRYSTGVVADTVQFLGGRGDGEQSGSGGNRGGGNGSQQGQRSGHGRNNRDGFDQSPPDAYDSYIPEPADDDIPF